MSVTSKRDLYPIPAMETFFDSLVEAAVFSTQDANSAYRQV